MKSFIKINLFLLFVFLFHSNLSTAQQPNFRWAFNACPNGAAAVSGLSVDQWDNSYITFRTYSNNYSTTIGDSSYSFNVLPGEQAIFFYKVDPLGNLLWKKQIKIKGDCGFYLSTTVDKDGNLYITSSFIGQADFNPGSGIDTFNTQSYNGAMFVAKYSTDGDYIWSNCALSLTPNNNDYYWSRKYITSEIVIDHSGATYVYGTFHDSINFNLSSTAHILSVVPNTNGNYFLWKVDSSGNFGWVNDFGGNYHNGNTSTTGSFGGLAISPPEENGKQTLVVTGGFSRVSDFDPGPSTAFLAPDSGVRFMAKYQTNNELVWVGNFDRPNTSTGTILPAIRGTQMSINSNREIYITGNYVTAPNINPGPGAPYHLPDSGSGNMFISKLSSLGNVIWAKVVESDTTGSGGGVPGIASPFDIALDNQENPYILGRVTKGGHVDFDPGPGTAIIIPVAKMQVFVLKLNPMGNFEWVGTTQGNTFSEAEGLKLAIDKHNNIYARGRFLSLVDFDPGVDTFLLNGTGMNNGFCFKWAQCPTLVDSANAIACNSYTINGQTFHSSGVYAIALTNSSGCDSIVKLNITLEPLVNTFSRIGDTLIADAPLATYQWLACDNLGNKTPIMGATSQRFRPPNDGQYAVAVAYQDCKDTSVCMNVEHLGIADITEAENIQIVPNPVTNQCQVLFDRSMQHAQLLMTNALGRQVWVENDFSGKSKTIDMSGLSPGIYYLTIKEKGSVMVKKVVKW